MDNRTDTALGRSLLASDTARYLTKRARVDRALGRLGLSSRFHQQRNGVATILGYHAVGERLCASDPRMVHDVDEFRTQMRFLAEQRNVVPLAELLDLLAEGDPIPRGTVVITIDDGYTDTLDVAAPIIGEHGLHATVYLSGGFIEADRNMPIDDLYWSFTRRTAHELPDGLVPHRLRRLDATNEREAFDVIAGRHLDLAPADRDVELAAIRDALAPVEAPPRRMMTWDEVARLGADDAVTLGVHPHRHADLRGHPGLLDDELLSTRDAIAAATGETPLDMSYAYNRQGPDAAARVAALGFRSALGAGLPFNTPGTSAYDLVRIDAPHDLALLKAWTL